MCIKSVLQEVDHKVKEILWGKWSLLPFLISCVVLTCVVLTSEKQNRMREIVVMGGGFLHLSKFNLNFVGVECARTMCLTKRGKILIIGSFPLPL